ncbi:hypothetical protein EHS86_08060 [Erwinia amylovora]|nr:hypothetical protein AD997_05665 [Erwinia amylovora]RWS38943.1 hypothetical protein EHS86_08060 [Erwinia amylovora]
MKMLRCSRCGCRRFIFTKRGDRYGEHHGAICAACHKCMNVADLSVRSPAIRAACGKTDIHNAAERCYSVKLQHS